MSEQVSNELDEYFGLLFNDLMTFDCKFTQIKTNVWSKNPRYAKQMLRIETMYKIMNAITQYHDELQNLL